MKIVDPYFGERTLDVLESIKGRHIKAMTRLENLRDRDRSKLMRELADFKTENQDVEFRNYPLLLFSSGTVINSGPVLS